MDLFCYHMEELKWVKDFTQRWSRWQQKCWRSTWRKYTSLIPLLRQLQIPRRQVLEIEVYYWVDRLLNVLHGMWSSMKITLFLHFLGIHNIVQSPEQPTSQVWDWFRTGWTNCSKKDYTKMDVNAFRLKQRVLKCWCCVVEIEKIKLWADESH